MKIFLDYKRKKANKEKTLKVFKGEEEEIYKIEWISEKELLKGLQERDFNIEGLTVDNNSSKDYIIIKINVLFNGLVIYPIFKYYFHWFKNVENETLYSKNLIDKLLVDLDNNKEKFFKKENDKIKKKEIDKNVNELLEIYGKYISSVAVRKGKGDNDYIVLANERLKSNLSEKQLDFIKLIESRGYTISSKKENIKEEDIIFSIDNFFIVDNKVDKNFNYHKEDFAYISSTLRAIERKLNTLEFQGKRYLKIEDGWNNDISLSQYKILKILEAKGYEVDHLHYLIHPNGPYFSGCLHISWH